MVLSVEIQADTEDPGHNDNEVSSLILAGTRTRIFCGQIIGKVISGMKMGK